MNKKPRPELISKCLELMYSQGPTASVSSIAAGVILSFLFWGVVPNLAIATFAFAYGAITLIRYLLGKRFELTSPDSDSARYWARYFALAVFTSGLIWGTYGIYLAQYSDLYSLAAVVLTLGALVSGSVTAYGVSRLAYLSFVLPTLLPISFWLILTKNMYEGGYLGIMMIAWLIFLSLAAMRFRSFALESLGYQFDNVNLVRRLSVEKDKAEALAAKLKTLSSVDSLTNIANRRAFDEEFELALTTAKQLSTPLTLIICDIDYFKSYNDGYGHIQGDVCLRSVAAQIESIAQYHKALAARIGGEEFAVLQENTNHEKSLVLAETLRLAIEQLAIPHQHSEISTVITGSFGVCSTIPNQYTRRTDLLKLADEALYKAKHAGRNRVFADQPKPLGTITAQLETDSTQH